MPRIVKVLIALAALALGIFLVLFVASRIAGYNSVGDLVSYLLGYLGFIVERSG